MQDNGHFARPSNKLGFSARFAGWVIRHVQQGIGSLGDLWRTPFTSVMTVLVLGISLTLPATSASFRKKCENSY